VPSIPNPFAPPLPAPQPLAPPLTLLNPAPLPFAEEELDRCREAAKRRARPSNKIAAVKPYQRRMSQNSIDNLRRG